MITLQNDTLTAQIHPKGAELQGLQHTNGLQYMWSGDAGYWGKFSPVLFPIVGTLKNDTYIFEDKEYHLPRHGFARDKVFTVDQISDTEAVFSLTYNEETIQVYPFQFTLKLRYKLYNNELSCTYEVINEDKQDIYFSVGAHPAFAVPLENAHEYTDYYLKFHPAEPLFRHKLADGLISNNVVEVNSPNGELPLSPELFSEDALVFKYLKTNEITLGSPLSEHGLRFRYSDFPFLGIWAARNAPFVCIEPWCGIADSVDHNQQLTQKEGINKLAPGEQWQRIWSVACY
jgi:galactose mutarotase-like enzyme